MDISTQLRELRAEKALTQGQLAAVLGITQDSISLWEKGKRVPDTQYIIKLADFFEVSADYLLGRSDDLGAVNVHNSAPSLSDDEAEMLRLFRELPADYRALALDTLRTWTGVPAKNGVKRKA